MSDGRCNGSSASRRGAYNAVIERTTQLDTRLTTRQISLQNLANLRWTAERTVEVL